MRVPVPSRRALRGAVAAAVVVGLLLVVGLVVALVWVSGRLDDQEQATRRNATAARRLAGQVTSLGGEPVVAPSALPLPPPPGPLDQPDPDDPESQQPERQQPERQERERQQAERQQREEQQRERQQAEEQQAERQQDEIQQDEVDQPEPDDPEVDQPEPDDPDPDDPEQQDPEVDDPDPNSALNFAVDDSCNPPAGEFITDVSASWQRSPGTVTLVLTCTSAVVPPPGNQP